MPLECALWWLTRFPWFVKIRCVPLFSARLETLFVYFFCCVGFADSACPMTFGRVATVQPKAVTLVHPLSSFVRQWRTKDDNGWTSCQNVVPNAVNIKKQLTPLERELEAVEGSSLAELRQPVAEVLGRVSIDTLPRTSGTGCPPRQRRGHAFIHSCGSVSSIKVGQTRSWWL